VVRVPTGHFEARLVCSATAQAPTRLVSKTTLTARCCPWFKFGRENALPLFGDNDDIKIGCATRRFCWTGATKRKGSITSQVGSAVIFRPVTRSVSVLAVTATDLAISACGTHGDKTYDISPLFPLSANKCVKYDGTVEGTGIAARCWVTKSQCNKAASDWRQAMRNVPNAIEFSC
jgi:hypothetical protein